MQVGDIKLTQQILTGVEHHADIMQKIPRAEIEEIADEFLAEAQRIGGAGVMLTLCGSYRRGKLSSGLALSRSLSLSLSLSLLSLSLSLSRSSPSLLSLAPLSLSLSLALALALTLTLVLARTRALSVVSLACLLTHSLACSLICIQETLTA